MKSFLTFLTESATQQAARMGLTGDGHGGWYKDGEFVAKTEKGRLKFYNKKQKVGGKDPASTEKEKNLSGVKPAGAKPQQPKGKVVALSSVVKPSDIILDKLKYLNDLNFAHQLSYGVTLAGIIQLIFLIYVTSKFYKPKLRFKLKISSILSISMLG